MSFLHLLQTFLTEMHTYIITVDFTDGKVTTKVLCTSDQKPQLIKTKEPEVQIKFATSLQLQQTRNESKNILNNY